MTQRDRTERPDDAREEAAKVWARQAAAGGTRIGTPDMNPRALAVKRFPMHFNLYESTLLQMAADLEFSSKQKTARRAIREYCERKLRAAGVTLPK